MLSVLMVQSDGACLYNLDYKSLTVSVPTWLDEILGFILHSHLRHNLHQTNVLNVFLWCNSDLVGPRLASLLVSY